MPKSAVPASQNAVSRGVRLHSCVSSHASATWRVYTSARLDESQRAMVAARIANMKVGDNKGITRPEHLGRMETDTPQISAADAARMMRVGRAPC